MRFWRGTCCWALQLVLLASPAFSAVNVFLDFDAQWRMNLAAVASVAGVPVFDALEIATMENAIQAEFSNQLADFDVQLTTVDPGGFRERVHFGAQTNSSSQLGSSIVNFRNTTTSTASVFSANFGFIVEAGEDRANQLAELSMALSGTGLHELGHSFGLRHHDAYGNMLITPSQYANTQGIQNRHLMGTGSTGITEEQREQSRTYSQWSKVIMEAAINLTPQPIPVQHETADAGDEASTALLVNLTSRDISRTDAGLVFATLATEADVDLFAFDVSRPSLLTAGVWSQALLTLLDDFDSELRLLGPDGSSILAVNDQIRYSGNTFDAGPAYETDSLLLNIPLDAPGRYYLQVSSNGTVTDPDGGGIYRLLMAISNSVPEPGLACWVPLALAALAGQRRRHRQPAIQARGASK